MHVYVELVDRNYVTFTVAEGRWVRRDRERESMLATEKY